MRLQHRNGQSGSAGFTLIELLVALTILTGLMAVTYSGFRVALTMWEKGNARTETFQEQRTTLAILREQIRGAIPILVTHEAESNIPPNIAFEGQPGKLRFISRSSWIDGSNAVPRWIELTWEGHLTVEEKQITPPFNAPRETAMWRSEQNVFQDLRFSYLRRATTDRPYEWLESWDISQLRQLPAAVQVKYRFQDEWGVLLVPLDYAEANWQGYSFQ